MAAQPSWPALYGMPVIQRRISISRASAPPTEDSDVIVLNSRSTFPDASAVGAEVLYLDLRLSLANKNSGSVDIDWAFAGLRETTPLEREADETVRYHWRHAIDSHDSDRLPDEGTMVRHEDGSGENIEIETGVGVDPNTGKVGLYEEVWKSEHIPSGTAFAFVVSNPAPDKSTRFMAVLGVHAIGFFQTPTVQEFATDDSDESQHFHAVRLQHDNQGGEGTLPIFRKVFSTGYQILEDQLEKFAKELLVRGIKRERSWKRGEKLTLGGDQGEDPSAWAWVVWDAGYIH